MRSMKPIAVVAGARTPQSKAFTDLKSQSAVDLGQHALTAALARGGLSPSEVDEVVMGNVSGQPDAANMARVIALKAGVPHDRIAHTVNRNCASGMESVISAWQAIESNRANVVVAGGTESMSNVPLLFRQSAAKRFMQLAKSKTMSQRLKVLASFRPKHFKPVVGLELGLTDPTCGLNMGQTAEILAKEFDISRDDQDAFALESHLKALAAQERCFLSGEIAPLELGGKKIEKDNGPRQGQTLEALAKLRPFFDMRFVWPFSAKLNS